jgi:hypothetical protein
MVFTVVINSVTLEINLESNVEILAVMGTNLFNRNIITVTVSSLGPIVANDHLQ